MPLASEADLDVRLFLRKVIEMVRGILRIRSEKDATRGLSEGNAQVPDEYLQRLLKLIPAEVQMLYSVGLPFLTGADSAASTKSNALSSGAWSWACLAVLVLIRAKLTAGLDKRAQWWAVGISAVSFGLWVLLSKGGFAGIPVSVDSNVVAAVTLLWVTVLPFLYKGESS